MIKAMCIESGLNNATFLIEGEKPVGGSMYVLEPYSTGTGAQNRAFHSLVQEYWRSGMHSYNADSFMHFRDLIKRHLGVGFESFAYADIVKVGNEYKPSLHVVADYSDVPEHIKKDPDMKNMIRGRLKSWSDYTQKQRRETLDRLIAEMQQVGVNTQKFQDILGGMER